MLYRRQSHWLMRIQYLAQGNGAQERFEAASQIREKGSYRLIVIRQGTIDVQGLVNWHAVID